MTVSRPKRMPASSRIHMQLPDKTGKSERRKAFFPDRLGQVTGIIGCVDGLADRSPLNGVEVGCRFHAEDSALPLA